MANGLTFNEFVGVPEGVDGVNVLFNFTFEYITESDIKVSIDGSETTEYIFANATTIQFNNPPTSGSTVRIFRSTDVSTLAAGKFFAGSAIKASTLNDNFEQSLFVIQEGNFNAGEAQTNAAEALSKANTAISDSSTALSTANTALTDSSNAQAAASSAATDAASAAADAQTAVTAASAAAGLAAAITTDGSEITLLQPINANQGVKLPIGNNNNGTSYEENGSIRYNDDSDKIELFNGVEWQTAAGGASVGSTPPSPASEGDVWFDPDNGRSYVYFVDADSAQWIEMSPASIGDAITNVSELTNDAGYITASDVVVPTNTSELSNDSGFVSTSSTPQVGEQLQWNGSAWVSVVPEAGAKNGIFWENDTVIAESYTITSGKNAMTAGAVTINDGVVVEIPDGSTWTIV